MLRRALAGRLPEPVRLRRDKVFFDALLREALTGPDRRAVDAILRQSRELGSVARRDEVRALWTDGPERHPHGPWRWSAEVWRAFAAETWLRGEA